MTKQEALKACDDLSQFVMEAVKRGFSSQAAIEMHGIILDIRMTISEFCKESAQDE